MAAKNAGVVRRPTAFVTAVPLQPAYRHAQSLTRRRAARTAQFSMCAKPYPLPPPPVPKTPLDRTLGEQTAVTSVSSTDSTAEWLASALDARAELPPGHPLAALRDACDASIGDAQTPTRRVEQWRFTDLRSVYASRYVPAGVREEADVSEINVRRYAPDTAGIVLVFVDGVFKPHFSLLNDDSGKAWLAAGGYFGSVAGYGGDTDKLATILSEKELDVRRAEGGLFPTLGNAIATDIAVLDIPDNFSVSRPVAVVFLSSGGDVAERASICAPRLAVLAGEGSKITLLETHASLERDGDHSLSLAGAALRLGARAHVSHYIVNGYALDAHVLGNVHASVAEAARYEVRTLGVGAKLGRWAIGVDLVGEGAHGLVHSALVADGYQIADVHTRICHDALSTTSDQLQKNIATDHARAIFSGKIIVTSEGQKTDSSQLCRSLLLSNKASVDAMPVLEIAADDVKCSHGATVSDLQDDELFYCQSRGLSRRESQFLLISGFAMDVVGDCPFPTVREQVTEVVQKVAEHSLEREQKVGEFTSI